MLTECLLRSTVHEHTSRHSAAIMNSALSSDQQWQGGVPHFHLGYGTHPACDNINKRSWTSVSEVSQARVSDLPAASWLEDVNHHLGVHGSAARQQQAESSTLRASSLLVTSLYIARLEQHVFSVVSNCTDVPEKHGGIVDRLSEILSLRPEARSYPSNTLQFPDYTLDSCENYTVTPQAHPHIKPRETQPNSYVTQPNPPVIQPNSIVFHNQPHVNEWRKEVNPELKKCQYCSFKSARQNNMNRHVKTMHTKCKKDLMPCCGISFDTKGEYLDHKIEYHSNGYTCHICDLQFSTFSVLRRHYMVHSSERLYECPQCDYKTGIKGNVKRHIKNVHRNSNAAATSSTSSVSAEQASAPDRKCAVVSTSGASSPSSVRSLQSAHVRTDFEHYLHKKLRRRSMD